MTARVVTDDEAGRAAGRSKSLRQAASSRCPTDTVYGIGVALDAPRGIERLFEAKARDRPTGDRAAARGAEQAADVGSSGRRGARPGGRGLAGRADARAAAAPGRRPCRRSSPAGRRRSASASPTTRHPRALASAVGPLPVTSANVSGRADRRARRRRSSRQLGAAVDLVLDGGPARGERPSTVVDCSGARPRLLRDGVHPGRRAGRRPRRGRAAARSPPALSGVAAAAPRAAGVGRSATTRDEACTGDGRRTPGKEVEMTIAGRSQPRLGDGSPTSTRSSGPRWRASATASTGRSS